MTLYHFCAAHMVQAIRENGLTLGGFPLFEKGKAQFLPNHQWLTVEPDSRKQSWATSNMIDYSRTDYRLTVNIPESRRRKLVRAADFVKDMPEESRFIVENWDGSDKWYIYLGKIPAKWIVGCRKQ